MTGISVLDGKTYEEIFDLETKRVAENKSSHTPWGGGTVVNMKGKVLHGYDRAVHGLTAEERLDIRAGTLQRWFTIDSTESSRNSGLDGLTCETMC